MVDTSSQVKRVRALLYALITSSFLNAILLTITCLLFFKERPPTPYFSGKPALPEERQVPLALDKTSTEVLRYFKSLSFERLLSLLTSKSLVENGYTERDLALGMLVTDHHFDLERALGMMPKEARRLAFDLRNEVAEAIVYPSLSEHTFETIVRFASQEKWPLTARGLFEQLKSLKKSMRSESLEEAFFLTPHFLAAERLLKSSKEPIENQEIVDLLTSGEWTTLFELARSQNAALDLSDAKRQKFLVDYLEMSSKYAAKLLLKTDREFALKKLDDRTVMLLLALLEGNEVEIEGFALELLASPRCDLVLKSAKSFLVAMKGEEYFLKELNPYSEEPSPLVSNEKHYVVQEGDSLWKISRRFKVDIDHLRRVNHLHSDLLRPGASLRIP